MKRLEDRIKDRLEGYESSLPEGDLAEFKAMLDSSVTAGNRRSSAYLAWLAPVAVAAGLALFFILGHGPKQDMIQVANGSPLVADVVETQTADVDEVEEMEPVEHVTMVQATLPGTKRKKQPGAAVSEAPNSSDSAVPEQNAAEQVFDDNHQSTPNGQTSEKKHNNDGTLMGSSTGYSPFVPSGSNSRKPVSMKVGQATAQVLGGTGALALASVIPSMIEGGDMYNGNVYDDNPGGTLTDPETPVDGRTGDDTHYMPLRAGLSFRIPLTDRCSLTTGIDYSWYASRLEYSISGIHKQNAHYLGVPLRADFTIARNRWMDVYVCAGGSVDFCVAAFDAGQKIAKDGIGVSLVGASGVQFNITRNLGLFLDPTFSWSIPSNNRVLETYRSEYPFMFTVSTGMRITIPNRK
ncbi:MAG: PorT family protein [Bacteroidaceae bacterium]|nr:PorT family protein [Bacteroidaceae bacterium]